MTANHRGGYRRPINDDDGSRNKVTAIHSQNSALLHLRKLNRGRREGRDCRGWSGASAQGVYGVAGWQGQQTHQTPKRNERSLPAGGTLHRSSYTQGLTRHVDRNAGNPDRAHVRHADFSVQVILPPTGLTRRQMRTHMGVAFPSTDLAKLPTRGLLDNLREGGLADRLVSQDYLRHGEFTTVNQLHSLQLRLMEYRLTFRSKDLSRSGEGPT